MDVGFTISILTHPSTHKVKIFGIGKNDASLWNTYDLRKDIVFNPISNTRFLSKISMYLKYF